MPAVSMFISTVDVLAYRKTHTGPTALPAPLNLSIKTVRFFEAPVDL